MNMNETVKKENRQRWKYFELCIWLMFTNHRLTKKNMGATAKTLAIMAEEKINSDHLAEKNLLLLSTAHIFLEK